LTLNRSDLIVVGGSQEQHVYDFNTDKCDHIMAKCEKRIPSIKVWNIDMDLLAIRY
jgi:hypothetical protein